MEQCTRSQAGLQVLKWSLGGCVPLTGSQLSALAFFGHGSSPESMCLHCNEYTEAFLKTALARRASMQSCMKREAERLPVSNLAWSSELHCQRPPPPPTSKYRRSPVLAFYGVMLPSAGICGSNMQT